MKGHLQLDSQPIARSSTAQKSFYHLILAPVVFLPAYCWQSHIGGFLAAWASLLDPDLETKWGLWNKRRATKVLTAEWSAIIMEINSITGSLWPDPMQMDTVMVCSPVHAEGLGISPWYLQLKIIFSGLQKRDCLLELAKLSSGAQYEVLSCKKQAVAQTKSGVA